MRTQPPLPKAPLLQLLLAQLAQYPQLDPQAVTAIASQEGLSGRIGDGGHAFGPFQLNNAGGLLTGKFPGRSPQQIQKWANSTEGINYALQQIAKVAGGMHGPQAVNTIASQFERPADIPKEIAGATAAYGQPHPSGTVTLPPTAPVDPMAPSPLLPLIRQQRQKHLLAAAFGLPTLPPHPMLASLIQPAWSSMKPGAR